MRDAIPVLKEQLEKAVEARLNRWCTVRQDHHRQCTRRFRGRSRRPGGAQGFCQTAQATDRRDRPDLAARRPHRRVRAVVPSTKGEQKFAFLQASPRAARAILLAAHARCQSGLPAINPPHDHEKPPDRQRIILDKRETSDGTSPVTRLLRGKGWLHEHPTGGNLKADSPKLHQNLAKLVEEFRGSEASPFGRRKEIGYVPGEGGAGAIGRIYP